MKLRDITKVQVEQIFCELLISRTLSDYQPFGFEIDMTQYSEESCYKECKGKECAIW
jgi:hypothetical protein